jgi:hypothetical protein
MNLKVLIGIMLVIVAGAGYWLYMGNSRIQVTSSHERQQENASVGRSFAQLLGMGQSLECTYEYNDGGNVSSGTMYMTNGGESIRGDFNFTQSGAGAMQMHMIRDGGYNYMWGSQLPQGMKMMVTDETKGQLFTGSDDPAATAINNTQYSCVPWREDASKFAVPTNVQFTDMTEMMESVKKMMGAPKIGEATRTGTGDTSGTPDIKAIQCAACDQVGAAREQCRQALGCK